MDAALKVCSTCKESLPHSAFRRNARLPDGLAHWCRRCSNAYQRAWVARNKEKVATYSRDKRNRDLDAARRRERELYAANREAKVAKASRWNKENRERRAAAERERRKNPVHALHGRVSAALRQQFRRGKGGQRTEALVGWAMTDLRDHLARQFVKGMGWHNVSEWHIDHIIPLCSFNIEGPECPEFRRAWALTNLRPLWAADNMSKGPRVHTLL